MVQRDISELVPPFLLDRNHFSEAARHFIQGHGPARYVMIVGDVRLLSEYSRILDLNTSTPTRDLQPSKGDEFSLDFIDQYWVSAMVLGHAQDGINLDNPHWGGKTQKVRNVDVLIPAHLSGLADNVLAETWHIVPMLVNQLSLPVGHRLSSTLYHHLMDIGDTALGKDCMTGQYLLASNQLQTFHQAEEQWSEVLRFPITACHMQLERLERTTAIMERAVWLERFSPQE